MSAITVVTSNDAPDLSAIRFIHLRAQTQIPSVLRSDTPEHVRDKAIRGLRCPSFPTTLLAEAGGETLS